MNQPQELSKEQQDAKNEAILMGEAFSLLLHSEAWKYIQSYFENEIKSFTNSLILEDQKEITEFSGKRFEVMGLRKLMMFIKDNNDFYEKETRQPTAK